MIGVDRIDDVRRLGRSGASVASIARDTGVSEPTVRECLREPDLSERPPVVGRAPGVAPARAVRGAGGLVAARGQAPLVQTAPHREEGVRQADGEGLRRLLRHGPAVREEERGARGRARRPGGAGVPAAQLARRRVPGGLRAGGLPRVRRRRAGAGAGPLTRPHRPCLSVRDGAKGCSSRLLSERKLDSVLLYRLLLLPLHLEQRTCRFEGTVLPPFETGLMWSMCRPTPSGMYLPQILQV